MSYLSNLEEQIAQLQKMKAVEESFSSKVTSQEKSNFLNIINNNEVMTKICNELGYSPKDANIVRRLITNRVTSWGNEEAKNSSEVIEKSGLSEVKPLSTSVVEKSSKQDYTYSEFLKSFYGIEPNEVIPLKNKPKMFKQKFRSIMYTVATDKRNIKSIYYSALDNMDTYGNIEFNTFSLFDKMHSYSEKTDTRYLNPVVVSFRGKNFISCVNSTSVVTSYTSIDFNKYPTFNVYHIAKDILFNILVSILSIAFPDTHIQSLLTQGINENRGKDTVLGHTKYVNNEFKINREIVGVEDMLNFFYIFTVNLVKSLGYSEEDSVDMAVSLFKEVTFFAPFQVYSQGGLELELMYERNDTWLKYYESNKHNLVKEGGSV